MGFLSAGCDVTPGTILARNACRGPWIYSLDFHLGVDVRSAGTSWSSSSTSRT